MTTEQFLHRIQLDLAAAEIRHGEISVYSRGGGELVATVPTEVDQLAVSQALNIRGRVVCRPVHGGVQITQLWTGGGG